MTTTIELAKEAGIDYRFDSGELEAFRALCVAERDKELIGAGMGPIHEVWISTDSRGEHYGWEDVNDLDELQWKKVVKASHRYIYTAAQLAAARLQGAEEERDAEWKFKCEVIAKAQDQIQRIAELEQQLAEKHHNIGDKHD